MAENLKLPINTMEVLKRRYLLRDEKQNIIESPSELFGRVAGQIAAVEDNFKSKYSREQMEQRFYQMMRNLEFLPNSPTLMNAGTEVGQLSACFVIPVEDSMEGIFGALGHISLWKIPWTGYLEHWVIWPGYIRQGVGRDLIFRDFGARMKLLVRRKGGHPGRYRL
jgi:ribonucleotide reductase alpha subunit